MDDPVEAILINDSLIVDLEAARKIRTTTTHSVIVKKMSYIEL